MSRFQQYITAVPLPRMAPVPRGVSLTVWAGRPAVRGAPSPSREDQEGVMRRMLVGLAVAALAFVAAADVTVVPPRDRGSEVLVAAAQRALVTSKERGGNTVVSGAIG